MRNRAKRGLVTIKEDSDEEDDSDDKQDCERDERDDYEDNSDSDDGNRDNDSSDGDDGGDKGDDCTNETSVFVELKEVQKFHFLTPHEVKCFVANQLDMNHCDIQIRYFFNKLNPNET